MEQAGDEQVRQALQVRIRELRHLERSERGLADAYRRARGLPGIPDHELSEIAGQHLRHATLLRERVLALGGKPDEEADDVWVVGHDCKSLLFGEHASLATYHDHLTDFDQATADGVRRFIMPEHAGALEVLDPRYVRDRDGDI